MVRDDANVCNREVRHECLRTEGGADSAGNFIDTANNYQSEESEEWIGEWMRKRGVRDQMGKFAYSISR